MKPTNRITLCLKRIDFPHSSNSVAGNAQPKTKVTTTIILLMASFFLLPFYFLTSGAFQPVDLAILFLSLVVATTLAEYELFAALRVILFFLPFLIWVICVNAYYILISGHLTSYLLATVQVAYGLVILFFYQVAFIRVIKKSNGYFYLLICLVCLSISPLVFDKIFQLSFVPSVASQIRQDLSFNNPNQLGYFSILLLCMFMTYHFFYRKTSFIKGFIPQCVSVVIFVLANWFVIASGSRAAIAGLIPLDVSIAFLLFRRTPFLLAGLSCIFIPIYGLFFVMADLSTYFQGPLQRLSQKEFFDKSELFYRSIKQMDFASDVSILIGNGANVLYKTGLRSLDEMFKGEVHNTFAGIFSQYGLIGLLLIAIAFALYIRQIKLTFPNVVILASIFLYNMSHYGLRFRLLWVALAFFVACSMFPLGRYKSHFSSHFSP